MKNDNINTGDIVLIKSAIDGSLLHSSGVGLVIELTHSVPAAPGYETIEKTCTLFWGGIVESDIDINWLEKISLHSLESVLADGENDDTNNR